VQTRKPAIANGSNVCWCSEFCGQAVVKKVIQSIVSDARNS